MDIELIKRHAVPVPRYTSYPTANHFHERIRPAQYVDWLTTLPAGSRLSLYVHVPFCTELCWYCACTTKATQRYRPVAHYMRSVHKEIDSVAALLPADCTVASIHLGGGSPSILQPDDIAALMSALHRQFQIAPSAEIAVEIDPRHLRQAQVDAFVKSGVNRVSLGVQDFDPRVQKAIGRIQSYEMTRDAVDMFRKRGVRSVNIDLVYGLPHQTVATITRTLKDVVALAPDRIAAFGYAHLPARVKPQRLIDESALPDAFERFAQSQQIVSQLGEAGYERIGLDHFALGADTLASETVRRNFQGYTTDPADALIGFGASAISQLPGGFAQNAVATADYERAITERGLATARGIALSEDDRMRAFVIERLMCDFAISASDLTARFGPSAASLLEEARSFIADDPDGLLVETPEGFGVIERGRPLVRSICAHFDRYLVRHNARHALAV